MIASKLRVYAIVDPSVIDMTPQEFCEGLVQAGIRAVQLRFKGANDLEIFRLASELNAICREHDTLFFVNDRVDIACASGAHGVHLGPGDLPVEEARLLAPELVIGASAGTVADARAAERAGADYLGCGAVFEARESKPDASAPRGLAMVSALSEISGIPIVGIGGISVERAPDVIEAGACGIAVIRALGRTAPLESARRLLSAVGVEQRTPVDPHGQV